MLRLTKLNNVMKNIIMLHHAGYTCAECNHVRLTKLINIMKNVIMLHYAGYTYAECHCV